MESEDELDMHDAHDDDDDSVDNEEDFYSGGDDDAAGIDSDDADVGDYEFVDNDSDDSDDMVSYRHQQNYIILAEADIQQCQEEDITRVSTVLSISKVAASILLRYYNWSVSKVHDEWFADEEKVRRSVGLLQKPVLRHSNELELPCGICFEIYPLDKIQSAACGHPFCNACWTAGMNLQRFSPNMDSCIRMSNLVESIQCNALQYTEVSSNYFKDVSSERSKGRFL
ncbi:putative E3 ubiquitin-protein ligase ARI8 isoform X2 [Cucumis melo var. makuwa]|uniref:Putative E3 ubiquitin-protein ligase ARI8 isoform X2 n=1 Tax=Cucumis melo var. makuwa TaxID=1194695 RepID=A0A5D3DJV4_CUCMM|nr:putative E3 ubiquitin-protein ligase ARI8 isoform X2 [Cucumis melo var. makuwa]